MEPSSKIEGLTKETAEVDERLQPKYTISPEEICERIKREINALMTPTKARTLVRAFVVLPYKIDTRNEQFGGKIYHLAVKINFHGLKFAYLMLFL